MKTPLKQSLLLLLSALAPLHAADDCHSIHLNTEKLVAEAPDHSAEIVASQVAASASCACEIVKSAIKASQADAKTVAAIVEAAINAAPEQMRLITQCAIATAPDALAEVQAVLARLDPNSGESGASDKDAKSAKDSVDSKYSDQEVASIFNPLEFPGADPVGSLYGGPGGLPPRLIVPPIINPPSVTDPNP